MHPVAPAASLSVPQVHSRLAALRFATYVTMQFCGMLVPLLVFHLTGSLRLAGVVLICEMVPKLACYFTGGALTQRLGSQRVFLGLEVGRLAAIGAMAACAFGFGNIWLLAAAAAVHQVSTALSNILFEQAVNAWWEPDERIHGHALQMRQDQFGRLAGLCVGLLVQSVTVVAVLALLAQLTSVLAVRRYRKAIFPQEAAAGVSTGSLLRQLRQDFRCLREPVLARLAFVLTLMGVPAGIALTSVVFFLERAYPGAAAGTTGPSAVLLLRVGMSLLALKVAARWLRSGASRQVLVGTGVGFLAVGSLVLTLPVGVIPTALAIATIGTAACFYSPWVRSYRQQVLERLVPASSRPGVTGVLMSCEVAAWLLAGLIMATVGNRLWIAVAAAGILASVGGLLLLRLTRSPAAPAAAAST